MTRHDKKKVGPLTYSELYEYNLFFLMEGKLFPISKKKKKKKKSHHFLPLETSL